MSLCCDLSRCQGTSPMREARSASRGARLPSRQLWFDHQPLLECQASSLTVSRGLDLTLLATRWSLSSLATGCHGLCGGPLRSRKWGVVGAAGAGAWSASPGPACVVTGDHSLAGVLGSQSRELLGSRSSASPPAGECALSSRGAAGAGVVLALLATSSSCWSSPRSQRMPSACPALSVLLPPGASFLPEEEGCA